MEIKIQNKLKKVMKVGFHCFITHFLYFVVISLMASALMLDGVVERLCSRLRCSLVPILAFLCGFVVLCTLYFMSRPRPVYLVDHFAFKPSGDYICSREKFMECSASTGAFTEENLLFQRRILERSGIGQKSYVPTSLTAVPPRQTMTEGRAEAEMVMFGAVDGLLARAGVEASEIGVVVVNCSLFNPTPSLSSMIVNHYGMREDVVSYSLGGMGCSAGLIAIDVAKDLLQVHKNTYALVVSMENLTLHWYFGNKRSMLVTNCLFRTGGAAILLSNRRRDRKRSKYQLLHTVRTHKGADDHAYGCVFQEEDSTGRVGVTLAKSLMEVAGEALKANITTLGPLVLPVSEQLLFFATLVARKVLKLKQLKPYIPDFKLAFEHFCIHAGGRAVLDELEKNLGLSGWHMEPSRMTLQRFGNTSSSSLWYELAYTEAKGRVAKGDRVWQIGFGSGFKCNSAVWRALRTIHPAEERKVVNPWMEEIHEFPVHVPVIASINGMQ